MRVFAKAELTHQGDRWVYVVKLADARRSPSVFVVTGFDRAAVSAEGRKLLEELSAAISR
jgi:hypothetical protein